MGCSAAAGLVVNHDKNENMGDRCGLLGLFQPLCFYSKKIAGRMKTPELHFF